MLDLRAILSSHQIQTQKDCGTCGQLKKKDCYYVKVGGEDAIKSWVILRAELKDFYPIIMPKGAFEEDRVVSQNHQEIEKDFLNLLFFSCICS